jgi:capsular exopolysaccharide synthesis family protein
MVRIPGSFVVARRMPLDERDDMELRQVLAALRASWWLPLIGLMAGGAAALGLSLLQTPLYTSSTELFVAGTQSGSSSDVLLGSQFSQQRVTTYAQLVEGEEVASRILDRLDLDLTPDDLRGMIDATATTDTVLLSVAVTDTSAERAQQIAESLGEEFPDFVAELETPESGGPSPVKVTVTDPPEIPAAPSSPDTIRNLVLGVLIGLLLGAGIAVARAWMDRSVTDADEATDLVGAPVIGAILRDDDLNRSHTTEGSASSRVAEDYRQLRNNLQFLNIDEPPRVIMVSSAIPSEGKTTLVINLALALAHAGQRVVIVEADVRRPKVTKYLGLVGGVGLTNVLAGTAELDDVLQPYGVDALMVLAGGPMPPNPGELLASSHMQALLDKLRGQYDYVLVDAPPLLPVADASGLAPHVDGVLLSVRYGSTRKEQLRQAVVTVQRGGGKTLGLILNIVPPKASAAGAYGYGYSYEVGKHAVQ